MDILVVKNSNIGYTLAIIIRYVWQRPIALTDHLQSGSIKKQVGQTSKRFASE
ncbi:hypothetical protein HWD87_11710 [Enterococcus gallinarum]|uniref:hypothetical protein n=1 Tax=Enterococcus TaxID=1350 RepID=UPI0017A67E52|nr:hypothetical protein [Enterococcus gallinarum]MCR1942973.1 hypothetical protein [Enterococcus gallinarum]MDL4874065.1 hypothetical protein [Enterococcus gallinarum]NVI95487.1 hypothetical protein [Enterococcus gallinarum]